MDLKARDERNLIGLETMVYRTEQIPSTIVAATGMRVRSYSNQFYCRYQGSYGNVLF